jgi:hypothetical protein
MGSQEVRRTCKDALFDNLAKRLIVHPDYQKFDIQDT